MASASNFTESGVLSLIFLNVTFPDPPRTVAIALATGTLLDTMDGALGNLEVANAGAYARVVYPRSGANWRFIVDGAGASGQINNVGAITFPTATANWGQVTHVAIVNSGVYGAGQLLFHGPLTVAKTVTTNDTFSFSDGNLSIFNN